MKVKILYKKDVTDIFEEIIRNVENTAYQDKLCIISTDTDTIIIPLRNILKITEED